MNALHRHWASPIVCSLLLASAPALASMPSVLVFTRTVGFRHDSIPSGIEMLRRLGAQACFEVVATEDPAAFSQPQLSSYACVVFLCTTGDVLDAAGQSAFEAYMGAGGGWVGIHSATDTEYAWPFYGRLIGGAYFANHPAVQSATVVVESPADVSTRHLPQRFTRTDEWYNFVANPRPNVNVLLTLDESTYSGGSMGDHPIAWKHELLPTLPTLPAGRAWYTAGGHTIASYAEPAFEQHVLGGLLWAMRLDCRAEFDGCAGLGVQDLFDFLAAYFAGDSRADFNGTGGLSVQDIFDYLQAYFEACG